MGSAVISCGRIAVALLHQEVSLPVCEDRPERMVAALAGAFCDVESQTQERLVVGAKGGRHQGLVSDWRLTNDSTKRRLPEASFWRGRSLSPGRSTSINDMPAN